MRKLLDDGSALALGAIAVLVGAGVASRGGTGSRKTRVGSKIPVPQYIPETSRRAATGIYVYPKTRDFPIGDLYHARLALIYAMSPTHARHRKQVLKAVEKHYPQYAWRRWFRSELRRRG